MTASEMIRQRVAELNTLHPQAEFSYGYIGNCGKGFDDRLYMIFTQVPFEGEQFKDLPRRMRFVFEGKDAEGHLSQIQDERFDRWVAKVHNDVGSDAHQWWYRHIHRNDCPECGSRRWNKVCRETGSLSQWGEPRYETMCKCTDCKHEYPKA